MEPRPDGRSRGLIGTAAILTVLCQSPAWSADDWRISCMRGEEVVVEATASADRVQSVSEALRSASPGVVCVASSDVPAVAYAPPSPPSGGPDDLRAAIEALSGGPASRPADTVGTPLPTFLPSVVVPIPPAQSPAVSPERPPAAEVASVPRRVAAPTPLPSPARRSVRIARYADLDVATIAADIPRLRASSAALAAAVPSIVMVDGRGAVDFGPLTMRGRVQVCEDLAPQPCEVDWSTPDGIDAIEVLSRLHPERFGKVRRECRLEGLPTCSASWGAIDVVSSLAERIASVPVDPMPPVIPEPSVASYAGVPIPTPRPSS